jgi:hypothetical protein
MITYIKARLDQYRFDDAPRRPDMLPSQLNKHWMQDLLGRFFFFVRTIRFPKLRKKDSIKIDILCPIVPRNYYDRMLKLAESGTAIKRWTAKISAIVNLDVRIRMMDRFSDYFQAVSLAAPLIEALGESDARPATDDPIRRSETPKLAQCRGQDRPLSAKRAAFSSDKFTIRESIGRGNLSNSQLYCQPSRSFLSRMRRDLSTERGKLISLAANGFGATPSLTGKGNWAMRKATRASAGGSNSLARTTFNVEGAEKIFGRVYYGGHSIETH